MNRRFRVIDLGPNLALIREDVETTLSPMGGGWNGTIRLKAEELIPTGTRKPLFELAHRGEDGQFVQHDHYLITAFGCCGTTTGSVLFSLRTGKKLLYATGSAFDPGLIHFYLPRQVTTEPPKGRWLGVYTSGATYERSVFPDEPHDDARAVITYATETEPRARVRLNFAHAAENGIRERISIEKMDIDAMQTARIHFRDKRIVEIPIRGDTLELSRAKLPAGVTAEPLAAEWPTSSAEQ